MQHGSQQLYRTVRGALIENGQSLNQWCQNNGLTRQWVTLVLKGQRKGPAAEKIVKQVKKYVGLPE
jgi:gp16 family phage-associated protein